MAGYSGVSGEDVRELTFACAGASFKARAFRPELKFDYEYLPWRRLGPQHLFSGGWFIQSRQGTARPFFQFAWAAGFERYRIRGIFPGRLPGDPPVFVDEQATEFLMGPALATGVTVDLRGRFFFRPELRWRFLGPGPMKLLLPAMRAGWHF